MDQRTDIELSPYRIFPRAEWAALRADTPMTLEPGEIAQLRSLNDRLDIAEVEAALAERTRQSGLAEKSSRRDG